eukprot:8293302-Alexandrium_andersonii.AAC.1
MASHGILLIATHAVGPALLPASEASQRAAVARAPVQLACWRQASVSIRNGATRAHTQRAGR